MNDTLVNGVDLTIEELIDLRHLISTSVFYSHKVIRSHHVGNKQSKIKGQGIDFDQIREYAFGDDVRSIDWKATAKLQKTYTRIYKEERQRSILLLTDMSQNMRFGTQTAFKSVIAARLATLLGFSAVNHEDRVGAIIFSENNHIEIKPRTSKFAMHSLIQSLVHIHSKVNLRHKTNSSSTLYTSFLRLVRSVKPGSLVFIISDFSQFDNQSQILAKRVAKHNDLVFMLIYDPIEKHAPKAGRYLVNDEGRSSELNITSKKNREVYEHYFKQRHDFLHKFCRRIQQTFITIKTTDNLAQVLQNNVSIFK